MAISIPVQLISSIRDKMYRSDEVTDLSQLLDANSSYQEILRRIEVDPRTSEELKDQFYSEVAGDEHGVVVGRFRVPAKFLDIISGMLFGYTWRTGLLLGNTLDDEPDWTDLTQELTVWWFHNRLDLWLVIIEMIQLQYGIVGDENLKLVLDEEGIEIYEGTEEET